MVEDNAVNRVVVLGMLKNLGYQADTAVNGVEALAVVQPGAYDLVLMDCHMPELDGYEATRRIRLAENAQQRTPILAMTANAMAGDAEKCLAAGMDDFIAKPVRLPVLDEFLRKWLAPRATA